MNKKILTLAFCLLASLCSHQLLAAGTYYATLQAKVSNSSGAKGLVYASANDASPGAGSYESESAATSSLTAAGNVTLYAFASVNDADSDKFAGWSYEDGGEIFSTDNPLEISVPTATTDKQTNTVPVVANFTSRRDVSVVSAQQRYPWNGLVDIAYEVEEDGTWDIRFRMTVGEAVREFTVENVTKGSHTTVWDASAVGAFGKDLDKAVATLTAATIRREKFIPKINVVCEVDGVEFGSLQGAINSLQADNKTLVVVSPIQESSLDLTNCSHPFAIQFGTAKSGEMKTYYRHLDVICREGFFYNEDSERVKKIFDFVKKLATTAPVSVYHWAFAELAEGSIVKEAPMNFFRTLQEAIDVVKTNNRVSVYVNGNRQTAVAGPKRFLISDWSANYGGPSMFKSGLYKIEAATECEGRWGLGYYPVGQMAASSDYHPHYVWDKIIPEPGEKIPPASLQPDAKSDYEYGRCFQVDVSDNQYAESTYLNWLVDFALDFSENISAETMRISIGLGNLTQEVLVDDCGQACLLGVTSQFEPGRCALPCILQTFCEMMQHDIRLSIYKDTARVNLTAAEAGCLDGIRMNLEVRLYNPNMSGQYFVIAKDCYYFGSGSSSVVNEDTKTFFDSLASAIDNVADGQTIGLCSDNCEVLKINRAISFKIRKNVFGAGYDIRADTGYKMEITQEGDLDVCTFTAE